MKCEITPFLEQRLGKLHLEILQSVIRTLEFAPTIFPRAFVGCIMEGFGLLKKTLKPDVVPPKCYLQNGGRLESHRGQINDELLRPEPSHQEMEFELLTKRSWHTVWLVFTLCILVWLVFTLY